MKRTRTDAIPSHRGLTPPGSPYRWQNYADKPDISFVDFTSMVVMQDLGLTEVFTGDGHFERVGLGLRLVP